MDNEGYMFVGDDCSSPGSNCRVHVALHGCYQGKWNIGDSFAKNTGYLEWGKNLIILFPQADNSFWNPAGCWDFWGFTGSDYVTRNGSQPKAIVRMIERLQDQIKDEL